MKFIKIYLGLYFLFTVPFTVCIYVFMFVCFFASWTHAVNWACNKKFSRCPGCPRNVLCTFRLRAVSRAGTYI